MNEINRFYAGDLGANEYVVKSGDADRLIADCNRITAERDALQQRLTETDQRADDLQTQIDELEQRRRAEFEAGQAAERRVEVLEGLLRSLDEAWNSHDGRDLFGKPMRQVETSLKPAEGGGDDSQRI